MLLYPVHSVLCENWALPKPSAGMHLLQVSTVVSGYWDSGSFGGGLVFSLYNLILI